MNISNITPPQVWTSSSRSLTNFGSGALTAANTVNSTIAALANVDFRTSAGIFGLITVGGLTGAGATANITITLFDGTNNIQLAGSANAAAAPVSFAGNNNNTVGFRINNNDATHGGNYMVSQMLFTQ